ncbi:MAG: adenosine deaminase, partial [Myxococcota bacterium]
LDRVPELESHLVVDLVRDFGPDNGARVLAEVVEAREYGVVGIGIGGSEQQFPPEPWAAVFDQARRHGLHTSAHAGEAAGAQSVWGAIRALQVDRIGHGTRAIEDPELVAYLAEHHIPIEMCPLSNLRTGVVASLEEHPVRTFVEQGLYITINTDDPAMFNNTLADEYRLLNTVHDFSPGLIQTLILNALDASWGPPERIARLRTTFEEGFAACAPMV